MGRSEFGTTKQECSDSNTVHQVWNLGPLPGGHSYDNFQLQAPESNRATDLMRVSLTASQPAVSREGIEPPTPEGTCFTDRRVLRVANCKLTQHRTTNRSIDSSYKQRSHSASGSRTRKHEVLNFAAVPIRVSRQGRLVVCRLSSPQRRLIPSGSPSESRASSRSIVLPLQGDPRSHRGSCFESFFLSIRQTNRELVVVFHWSLPRVVSSARGIRTRIHQCLKLAAIPVCVSHRVSQTSQNQIHQN